MRRFPADGANLPASDPKPTLQIVNSVTTGDVRNIGYVFSWSDVSTFPAGSHTVETLRQPPGAGGETAYKISDTLAGETVHYWRAKATADTPVPASASIGGEAIDAIGNLAERLHLSDVVRKADRILESPWSTVGTFKTPLLAFCNGASIFDPLTNGKSVCARSIAGHFDTSASPGWQADDRSSGLDYDLPACPACTLEFDITNADKGFEPLGYDRKILSMGDSAAFSSFGAFRDHPWKMQLAQRSDGDGTGFEIIWRNGGTDAGGGDPGDHRIKILFGGPNYRTDRVFHYKLVWNRSGYQVFVDDVLYLADGWRFAFTPPNFRISFGCYPRNESFPGMRIRNVKLTPQ